MSKRRPLLLWTIIGMAFVAVLALLSPTSAETIPHWDHGVARPRVVNVIEWLWWGHVAYVAFGVYWLRGTRWLAAILGTVQLVLSTLIGLWAIMAATGAWL